MLIQEPSCFRRGRLGSHIDGKASPTERVMRPLKEECLWLQEWTSPFTLASALKTWIDQYNEQCLHSALGYKTPRQFEREYYSRHGTQLPAA
jgi:hypothetical protein